MSLIIIVVCWSQSWCTFVRF